MATKKKKSKKSLSFLTKKAAPARETSLLPVTHDMIKAAREFIDQVGPAWIPRVNLLKKGLAEAECDNRLIQSIDIALLDDRVVSIKREVVAISFDVITTHRLVVSVSSCGIPLDRNGIITNVQSSSRDDSSVFRAVSTLFANYNGKEYSQ